MDPLRNPFSPGAGSRPPELAGREDVVAAASVALGRVVVGRSAQSQIFLGLRGTGKTVLLNEVLDLAESSNYLTSFIESPENKALTDMLYPQMRQVLRKLSAIEAARHAARGAFRALRSFASVFKITMGEVEMGVDPEPGVADSGNLEIDLAEVFEAIGNAAKAAGKGWVLLIDEVQYLKDDELAAVIVAVHRMSQRNLPVLVFAGGLPQVAKLSGDAKSYAERLFIYPKIGALDEDAAKEAIQKPLRTEGADITPEALDLILQKTGGYPFFLQEWGHHAWNTAAISPITLDDVEIASQQALDRLDAGFFRVRFDRLTKAEVDYVKAMASLGAGPYKVNDIAQALKMEPKSLGPRRASIIKKGMIYAPSYGDIDFTVPLFDDFLRRTRF
ncbi:ATPase [Agrobacterium vitis]|uniref:AAA family ATPase n=1 Tax=Rhizobium/Agrobacterium group TaxID=227290 RepID=UPI0012E7C037|nr:MULTISPECIES: ATP-binding protein [Rhizobium/Agrobacterium group]MCF1470348.1 ATP-binding protein [Allorhizobium ampelinum]MVA50190.1 AAA family ATPase [Agrobacterium vitis]NSZ54141.1 ATP-binding protein [Agrobacterium vitis]NTA32899.1 ATP-binding protein [Agrobacterium vitis]BCH63954.1 ATPase [Agrobacterium vitis]